MTTKKPVVSKTYDDIERYDFDERKISKGILTISENGSRIMIEYKDQFVHISATAVHHPLLALEALRLSLEENHGSILAINGCRKDMQYRMVGDYKGYICQASRGKPKFDLFSPTDQIEKLCTVAEHKLFYEKWLKRNKK